MRKLLLLSLLSLAAVLVAATPSLAEVKVAKLDQAPPADALAEGIVGKLAKTGYKITDGDKTICEFWLAETWTSTPGFTPSTTVLYPIEPGTLVGAIRFPDGGHDFRDQELVAGVYTIRYARQPQDGNHIGTSDTLDFLLLSKPSDDQDPAPVDAMTLVDRSAMAAGSTHPAMMALRPAPDKVENPPVIHTDEARNWTSVRVVGTSQAGDAKTELQLEFVVVGHAE